MRWLAPYWLAQMFLTRLPAPVSTEFSALLQARAMYCYPLVGLVIGGLLALLAWVLPNGQLGAAIVLSVWVLITGGLHLDGLGDSADGWLGGLGDRARTLDIMRDPRAGVAAVFVIVLLLLVKFAALASLSPSLLCMALLAAPVLARCVPALLFFSTPYARDQGLASELLTVASRSRQLAWALGVFALVTALLVWQLGVFALALPLLLLLVLWALRALMLARIGGVTGDTVGASVEITEALTLVALALASNHFSTV